jgi:hypothetical protein
MKWKINKNFSELGQNSNYWTRTWEYNKLNNNEENTKIDNCNSQNF